MSFRLKTVVGIAAIEIILLAILVVSGLTYLKNSTESELYKRGQVSAELFASMTADAVISFDLATLDALVEQTLKADGLVYVRVRHETGQVLAQAGDTGALSAEFSEDLSVKAAEVDGLLDVSAPISVSGQEFGSVELGLSTAQVAETYSEARQWMLSIAASEIALVAVFGLLLGSVLTRQLARLRNAARKVAEGDFGYEVAVIGKDELADTATSFNRMSRELKAFADEQVAARKKAEAGQAYAETVLEDALNSMPEGVIITTPDGDVSFANKGCAELYGEETRTAENIIQLFISAVAKTKLNPGDDAAENLQTRINRLQDAENNPQWQTELSDGRRIMTTQRRMSDGGVVIVDHDITELFEALERNQELELELMQTHKMEALGTMAGGVAHEINTPIQFIGDNLRFSAEAFEDLTTLAQAVEGDDRYASVLKEIDWSFLSEEVPSAIGEALQGVDRVSEIVQSIKAYAHPESDEKTTEDLEAVISNALTISGNQWKHHADVEVCVDGDVSAVPCYPGKLGQVLINLVVNAAQAISEHTPNETGKIQVSARQLEDAVVINVADNGPGICSSKIDQVFDMFFTTKAPGEGTGQGLAICKTIIESNHGGKLSVSSPPGSGAVFSIELPVHMEVLA